MPPQPVSDLDNRFMYHRPDEARARRHERLRAALWEAALLVDELCPDGREKSTAITKIEEAMFWGNAAIARAPQ